MTAAVSQHFVPGVSFDESTLADRRTRLGASEVAAVLGLNPHRSALDVYLEKRGLGTPFEGNEFTEWGLRIEPVVRAKFAELRNVTISQPGLIIHATEPWAACTPDGICEPKLNPSSPFGLEIKNKGARQAHKWGESGTDAIPHDVAAQVHFSMIVTGIQRWEVAALFGGNEFRTYPIVYDAELAAAILEQCRDFWVNHVEKGIEPAIDASKSATDYLKRKFAEHGDVIRDATHEEDALIGNLGSVRERIKTLELDESLLKNRLMQLIGADAGIVGRSGRITWKAPSGLLTSWKEVALALHPPQELIEKHSSPMSRRFLPTFPKQD